MLLDDEAFIRQVLTEAADVSGAHLLSISSHKFHPQGVTAVALLSESHIAFHSWPEHGYVAADAFTCGSHCNPEVAIKHLKSSLKLTDGNIKIFKRSIPTLTLV